MALVANVVIVGVSSSRIIPPHGSANRIVHSCKVKGKSMRICSVQLGNQALFMETGGFRSQQQWGEWRLALVLRCWFLLPYAFPRLGIVIQFHFTKGKRIANFCFSDHTPTNMGVAQGHSGSLEDKTLTHNLITWVTLKYERQAEHTSGLWIHLPYSNQLKYKGRPHERNDPKILTTCFGYKVSQIGSWNWIFFSFPGHFVGVYWLSVRIAGPPIKWIQIFVRFIACRLAAGQSWPLENTCSAGTWQVWLAWLSEPMGTVTLEKSTKFSPH